ncbi:hypothetical protein DV737_g2976, partial [Chaetothyriales sp. CBS 132003]
MKILTKEEEREHYNATLKGGFIGLVGGLSLGTAGVYFGSRRIHVLRSLTLQMKAFLASSAATFGGIIGADHYSHEYERQRNPLDREYLEREDARLAAEKSGKTFTQRGLDWARRERYKIVFGSWIASMAAAFAIVNRNKYLTGQQKIVQARVYAQFLTLGVLVASAAFEISDRKNAEGRWETIKYVDPTDPERKRILEKRVERGVSAGSDRDDRSGADMWKDMVVAEERRLKAQEQEETRLRKEIHQQQQHNGKKKNANSSAKKEEKEEEEE